VDVHVGRLYGEASCTTVMLAGADPSMGAVGFDRRCCGRSAAETILHTQKLIAFVPWRLCVHDDRTWER